MKESYNFNINNKKPYIMDFIKINKTKKAEKKIII